MKADREIESVQLEPSSKNRFLCGIVNYADKFILLIGGYRGFYNPISDTDYFDIDANCWGEAPPLKVARYCNSSC